MADPVVVGNCLIRRLREIETEFKQSHETASVFDKLKSKIELVRSDVMRCNSFLVGDHESFLVEKHTKDIKEIISKIDSYAASAITSRITKLALEVASWTAMDGDAVMNVYTYMLAGIKDDITRLPSHMADELYAQIVVISDEIESERQKIRSKQGSAAGRNFPVAARATANAVGAPTDLKSELVKIEKELNALLEKSHHEPLFKISVELLAKIKLMKSCLPNYNTVKDPEQIMPLISRILAFSSTAVHTIITNLTRAVTNALREKTAGIKFLEEARTSIRENFDLLPQHLAESMEDRIAVICGKIEVEIRKIRAEEASRNLLAAADAMAKPVETKSNIMLELKQIEKELAAVIYKLEGNEPLFTIDVNLQNKIRSVMPRFSSLEDGKEISYIISCIRGHLNVIVYAMIYNVGLDATEAVMDGKADIKSLEKFEESLTSISENFDLLQPDKAESYKAKADKIRDEIRAEIQKMRSKSDADQDANETDFEIVRLDTEIQDEPRSGSINNAAIASATPIDASIA